MTEAHLGDSSPYTVEVEHINMMHVPKYEVKFVAVGPTEPPFDGSAVIGGL
jgi:hypothetical protein